MKRIFALLLILAAAAGLAACGGSGRPGAPVSQTPDVSSGETQSDAEPASSNILIAYVPDSGADTIQNSAALLQQTLGGELYEIGSGDAADASRYEYILLGFQAENSVLPQPVEAFLQDNDLGARTIYPFVSGNGNDSDAVFAAISQLQPGALLGNSALLLSADTDDQSIIDWARELGLGDQAAAPEAGQGNTVATAQVTPGEQQVLYLWEEGNAPATTEYTVNNGSYFDDPDFRPYLTSYPVPDGVKIKGAVLICPGGAFQFRSDQPEGVDVAEVLSALGYQSFVVDYRLRPYTQQEGALDLARAVRFVRAHAGEYGIDEEDIAVMGFSAGGILCGETLLHYDGLVDGTALDPDYQPDQLDQVSADAAACGMIYAFYGRLSVGTTDVELLRSGELPPTFYCYGTRDPFYDQFLANADAAEQAGVSVERLQLDGMPHGFGAEGGWINSYDLWLTELFSGS